jgi:hypothetical protein
LTVKQARPSASSRRRSGVGSRANLLRDARRQPEADAERVALAEAPALHEPRARRGAAPDSSARAAR